MPDLLGTRLPATGLPEPAAEEPARDTIDPRLGGPESRPQEWAVPAAAGAVTQAETVTAEAAAAPEPVREEAAAPAAATVPRNLPVVQAVPAVEAVQAPAAPARSGPTNAELLEQLRQMQSALAALTQQLGQLQQAHESFASASARRGPPPAPSPVPSPAPASTAERKPAQHKPAGAPAKVAAVRPATQRPPRIRPQETPAAVAEKPAAPLAGQLVAVDMWNGEPSVVVASGVPGDRRLRVLRPGDVVNGLALKSADPVARSATFAAPGSAGLTLFVNQGG
ncbi:hypothetical protein [Xylophilus sp. ASV27]|uniref:hypothetical protein n=1 Tax=Xylophilus sp. ASV27 TaxID=2795129 RepID=UPI001E5F52E8|nr:hypothetical protein [Xylophilus sp. ASV27]